MCQLPTPRQTAAPDGFTLMEVLVSITILAIGLMGSALLMSNTYKFSVRSRYMAEAAQLASEKLEDLNRFPMNDFHVMVNPGDNGQCPIAGESCEGSIMPAIICNNGTCNPNPLPAAISPANISANGNTYAVSYSDAVFISATNTANGNGSLQETYQNLINGNVVYETLTFSPSGQTPVAVDSPNPPPNSGETFDRRWVIEQDQPVVGVRRVTVLVTVMDQTIQPPVTFQMSMVRQ